ncbi:hypothetical protein JQS43_21780 [Natronosporangium hydrolyticum]|uniref:Uncharacterized protein n=1 Tax=Natronosporangium hydrolyticum TaxID=2811111 RepID=A0A895Y9V9_9ACTN|nr:hypothetical protein [Natronosporangium hydrolyticum]QSB14131.1 hypothetical protein JQS43_21780 [Natronosporangium hydrolyticum]
MSLDELFDRGDERRSSRTGEILRWLGASALAAVLLGAGLAVVLYALGVEFWYPVAPVAIFAVLLLRRAQQGLGPEASAGPAAGGRMLADYWTGAANAPAPVAELGQRPPRGDAADPDGLVPAVYRWESRLRWDRAGLWRGSRALHPHFVELVDERLRQRYGATVAGDPERARQLLGERVWRYVSEPSPRNPSPRELAAMVTTVEEL